MWQLAWELQLVTGYYVMVGVNDLSKMDVFTPAMRNPLLMVPVVKP